MQKDIVNTTGSITQVTGQEVIFFVPDTESIGKLKELKPKFSLTLKYKSADDWAALKDQSIRVFYMGIKGIPNEKGEVINCGVFVSEKEAFLSGQMTLIEAVRNLPSKTPLQITYRGKKANKSTNGQTMIFDVEKLG